MSADLRVPSAADARQVSTSDVSLQQPVTKKILKIAAVALMILGFSMFLGIGALLSYGLICAVVPATLQIIIASIPSFLSVGVIFTMIGYTQLAGTPGTLPGLSVRL